MRKMYSINCSKTPEGLLQMVSHINQDNLQADIGSPFKGCSYRGLAMFDINRHYSVLHVERKIKTENTTGFLCGVRKESQRELVKQTRIVYLKDNEYYCNTCGDFAKFGLKDFVNHVNKNMVSIHQSLNSIESRNLFQVRKSSFVANQKDIHACRMGRRHVDQFKRKTIQTSGNKPRIIIKNDYRPKFPENS